MTFQSRIVWLGRAVVLAVLIVVETATAAGTATTTVMVVPARKRMVTLAFQMAEMRRVGIVAYSRGVRGGPDLLHVWNGREWLPITESDYTFGTFLGGQTVDAYIVGDKTMMPVAVQGHPTWATRVNYVTDLDVAPIVNQLGERFNFNSREWSAMSRAWDMTLTDENRDRRIYGRYGPFFGGHKKKDGAPVPASSQPAVLPMPPIAEPVTTNAPVLTMPVAPAAPAIGMVSNTPAVIPPAVAVEASLPVSP